MITDCVGLQQWDLSDTETLFVQCVFALLKILIPVAIWVFTWKVCQTGRAHQRTSMLGLEERIAQQVSVSSDSGLSRRRNSKVKLSRELLQKTPSVGAYGAVRTKVQHSRI